MGERIASAAALDAVLGKGQVKQGNRGNPFLALFRRIASPDANFA
jgi:hypothetical protein